MLTLMIGSWFAGTIEAPGTLRRDSSGRLFKESWGMPGLKTVDGVAELGDERSAWFSDSEGNIFAIGQSSPQMMEMAMKMRSAAAGMG